MSDVCEQIIGVGIDVVSIARIEAAIKRRPRIVERIFSEEERTYCSRLRDPWENWAVRFAAKEAVMKALGASPGRTPWSMISIIRAEGRPRVRLVGSAFQYARSMGCSRLEVSLAHEDGIAVAVAIAIRRLEDRADTPGTGAENPG